jgi:plastocyanin
MVTFVITSKCIDQCSFHLEGIKAGAILDPGQSETWTVALAPGTYHIHCDVLPAMQGTLVVTT